MLLVNFAGQPGAGKSTIASGVFNLLKRRRWNVELITEYTKELIMQNDQWSLSDELIVFTEKYTRIKRMEKVDIVITDSPLINSVIYGKSQFGDIGSVFFESVSKKFDSVYFIVEPISKYIPIGRMPDENEAKISGKEIIDIIHKLNEPVYKVDGDEFGQYNAANIIESEAKKRGLLQFTC